ncbi:helix-turn-helix domain-containing protein [Zunongwangia pacifica]|uniref:Helix-turn-helix domain-containing protein n=1 Tax=Zunongwangia pacifica TaxID=2911062 RepID=A0A9X1ZV25_9FLAO|nr:helix-turn-helix domain-containing protein [Zunongwangia pacifica]MCL6216896.1 helix-turn-helix domain-containing protein [Zunongwangia pacifica]
MEFFDNDAEEIAYYKKKLDELRTWIELILEHFRPVMNGEIYLSGEEVCRLLHISKRTLQQYRDDNILPYVQIGGKIIFRQSDILHVLEDNYVARSQEQRTNE